MNWPPEDGLRFECTMCGNCCRSKLDEPYRYVTITKPDVERLRRFGFKLSASITKKFRGRTVLKLVEQDGERRCPFLAEDNKCSIHEMRPEQCRAFPWHGNVLESMESWEACGTRCEGIGRGELIPLAEIRKQAADFIVALLQGG